MSGSVGLLWWGSPIVVGKVPRGIMQGCEEGTCERPPFSAPRASFRSCVVSCGPGES